MAARLLRSEIQRKSLKSSDFPPNLVYMHLTYDVWNGFYASI